MSLSLQGDEEIDVEGFGEDGEDDDEDAIEEDDSQSVPGPTPTPLPGGPKRPRVQPEQALMSTVDNFIKNYSQQQQDKPEPDDIKAFCSSLEQKMRRIKDDSLRFELERQIEEICYETLMRDRARQAYIGPSTLGQTQGLYYQNLN